MEKGNDKEFRTIQLEKGEAKVLLISLREYQKLNKYAALDDGNEDMMFKMRATLLNLAIEGICADIERQHPDLLKEIEDARKKEESNTEEHEAGN